ncbi:MAG TPA: isopentenyl phosphate kinase [Anaerolineales bacterium]
MISAETERAEFHNLQLLKLGGSLITDKARARAARPEVIRRLAEEIVAALKGDDAPQVILGHGAGSFAHVPAKRYGTRQGVRTAEEWRGFHEVWQEARALNVIVMEFLLGAGLEAMVFPPSAAVISENGQVSGWDLTPMTRALQAGLAPVVHGDVIFDSQMGGTILSTEDLFSYLAKQLRPKRILLAGLEPGVWADYPERTRIIPEITPENIDAVMPSVKGSEGVDVTGGMASKVRQSLELTLEVPGLEVVIFSGDEIGTVRQALDGEKVGTLIHG